MCNVALKYVEEIVISPVKRQQILSKLKQVL